MRIAAWGLPILMGIGCGVAAAQSTAPQPQSAENTPAVAADTPRPLFHDGPEFEVATIKPSDPGNCCARTWGRQGRRLVTHNTYLRWLIMWAYGLQSKQIVGGPAWIDVDRFDITGEVEGPRIPTDPEWRVAVQKLLADRFQLQFHHEIREMPAYAVTIARGGPKLTKSGADSDSEPWMNFNGNVGQTMRGAGTGVTLKQFFGEVQRLVLDRPVVDRTGLTGRYDIQLLFTRETEDSLGMMQLPDNAAPNLITALDQQLGLKLEGVKAPVDVLVIDKAEPPSPD
jgi:uncharacterized protein (TIGR03435 family)